MRKTKRYQFINIKMRIQGKIKDYNKNKKIFIFQLKFYMLISL